jgi:hypothetical protein
VKKGDPEKGRPSPARERGSGTFSMHVSQIYDGDGDPPDMKIELEKAAADWGGLSADRNGVGSHGCVRPCAHQLNQDLLLFLDLA